MLRISLFLRVLTVTLLLASCTTQLERNLPESSADEILLALHAHHIGATKELDRGGGGFGIRVSESDVASSLAVLREEGLPRAHGPSVAETFAEPSLIPTAGEERARLSSALSSDLERTLETLPGVHDARVHVALPDPSVIPLDDQPEPRSASVSIRSETGATVDEAAIRTLVTGAVPGLMADQVHLVITPRAPSSEPPAALTTVGPITVTERSLFWLRGLFGASLTINVGLAIALLVVARRRRTA